MRNETKFASGLLLTVFVVALFAVKPDQAADVPAVLDSAVRVLGILLGTWIAAGLMHPFVMGSR